MMNLAVIGCGLIGRKRALAWNPSEVRWLYDVIPSRAEALAKDLKRPEIHATSLDQIFDDQKTDWVVVATTNAELATLTIRALNAGKHVLVEKPAAMTLTEMDQIIEASKRSGRQVRIGYNHRFHPALQKARAVVDSGVLGPLFMIRGRYGHGGRVGYDQEWRADPKLSGGGELMDQGVHLIDLASWFLGPLECVGGSTKTYFWKMPVDDNAFMHLENKKGATAWLQVSCTEWKNTFSLEIYGQTGKLHIEGLGGSYGTERLYHYQMLPEMGPPDTTVYEYPRGDRSWALEMEDFTSDLATGRSTQPGLAEARQILEIVEKLYGSSITLRKGQGP